MDSNTTKTILNAIGFLQRGQPREAIALLSPLTRGPLATEAWVNIGCGYEDLSDIRQAAACYCRALQNGESLEARLNLTAMHLRQGNLVEADTAAGLLYRHHPYSPEAASQLAAVRLEQGRTAEAVELFRRIGDESNTIYYGLHVDERVPEVVAKRPPPLPVPKVDGKLRIGFLSSEFREHPRYHFLAPVLRAIDRTQVEIRLYSDVTRPDERTREFEALADHWRNVTAYHDEDLASILRDEGLHALIDMTGHMPGNRMGVYRRRGAAVQILYPGYPGSTGVHDFIITDERGHDGPEIPLPITGGAQVYDPAYDGPCERRGGGIVFGAFHRAPKISSRAVALWAGAMKAVPDARLMLIGPDNVWLRARFADAGVDACRIIFRPRCSRADYMALHGEIDVMLDAYPYQGHSTTLDALWMGVPVVSLRGPSRHCREFCGVETSEGYSRMAKAVLALGRRSYRDRNEFCCHQAAYVAKELVNACQKAVESC